jgi:hypothetical protein
VQNYIIRYVEDLKAILEPTGCSIQNAIARRFPEMTREHLVKLRDAAIDLQRIVDLEIQERDDRAQAALDRHRFGGKNYDQASTPDGV